MEAIDLYLSKLAPHGLIAFNISNRYLDLGAVLAAVTGHRGLDVLWRHHRTTPAEQELYVLESTWGVVAKTAAALDGLRADARWRPLLPRPGVAAWTDRYSSLVGAWRKPE